MAGLADLEKHAILESGQEPPKLPGESAWPTLECPCYLTAGGTTALCVFGELCSPGRVSGRSKLLRKRALRISSAMISLNPARRVCVVGVGAAGGA